LSVLIRRLYRFEVRLLRKRQIQGRSTSASGVFL
jgi:hypothetical protein